MMQKRFLGPLQCAMMGLFLVGLSAVIATAWRLPPGATVISGPGVIKMLMVWGAVWAVALVLLRGQSGKAMWLMVIGTAVFVRLNLLAATPLFSDDIWRYLWEGKVQLAGHNPFAAAPLVYANSPLAAGDPFWPHINHPEISAIYPPVAQIVFALMAFISYTPVAMKVAMVVFDLVAMAVLIDLVRRRGGDPLWAAIAWGWCPLVCFEIAGAGHLDVLAVLFIVVWLFELERGRDVSAAFSLGLAIASKLIPLLLLPLAFRFHRRWWTVLIAPAVVALLYVPYLDWSTVRNPPGDATLIQRVGLEGPTRALREYTSRWRHNDCVFFVVYEGVVQSALVMSPDGEIAQHEQAARGGAAIHAENTPALIIAKRLCNIALLIGIGLIVWRARSVTSAALWTLGLWLLLSPVIHPWYVLLVLPLAIIERRFAWMLLSVTTLLTYWTVEEYLQTGNWHESTVAWAIQWGTFFAVLVWEFIRSRRVVGARADKA